MGVVLSTRFFLTSARNQEIKSEMNGDISSDTTGEKKMKTDRGKLETTTLGGGYFCVWRRYLKA